MSKITPSHNNCKTRQISPDKICSEIVETLSEARKSKSMESNIIPITPYNKYIRYIRLEGVMKNRKRCSLVVYAKKDKTVFEEYRIVVEKNRIDDDCIDFLKQYFI